jgi:leucyl aminopeptidase
MAVKGQPMEILLKHGSALKQKSACLIVGVFEGKLDTPLLLELDQALDGAFGGAHKTREFTGKTKEMLLLHAGRRLAPERVLLIGLGRARQLSEEKIRQAVGAAAGHLQQKKIPSCLVDLSSLTVAGHWSALTQTVAEGLWLATYRFDRYRSQKEDRPEGIAKAHLLLPDPALLPEAEAGLQAARCICRGVLLTRDLVNEPGNTKSPEFLADQAAAIAAETGMECNILDRQALEEEKLGAILGVAQGSVRDPRLIVLRYRGENAPEQPLALIGKGVVFDAGGISLKPAEKMEEMKMDMAGAAAVLGAMLAVALLRLPVHVVGLIPAVENLPSGSAIRPGDIITTASGQTIEVLNTDAEGRMILADTLTYAKRFRPRAVIDLATLTGACVIALGQHATAILGNDERLIRQLLSIGEATGERLWQLPLWDDYAEQIKSDIADVKNSGGRPAGTITAAAFLQKFAADFRWAHLDIAGTAWEDKGRHYLTKGGTGVGVRLLVKFLQEGKM